MPLQKIHLTFHFKRGMQNTIHCNNITNYGIIYYNDTFFKKKFAVNS